MGILHLQPEGNIKRWSRAAIDCYDRNCVCEGCEYENYFTDKRQQCQMKSAVLALVRTVGILNKEDLN